jgi:hypothetical protein
MTASGGYPSREERNVRDEPLSGRHLVRDAPKFLTSAIGGWIFEKSVSAFFSRHTLPRVARIAVLRSGGWR